MSQSIPTNENVWPIEKFATFQNEKWTNLNKTNLILKIHSDILLIIAEDTIHHVMKLTKSMKGYMKDNVLVIAYESEGVLNKIKMKFQHVLNIPITVCNGIEIFFSIHRIEQMDVNTEKTTDNSAIDYQDLFQRELERPTNFQNNEVAFPPGFPLKEFLKTCILDPSFPDMVDQIEKALHQCLY